jgi:hypothetical protein
MFDGCRDGFVASPRSGRRADPGENPDRAAAIDQAKVFREIPRRAAGRPVFTLRGSSARNCLETDRPGFFNVPIECLGISRPKLTRQVAELKGKPWSWRNLVVPSAFTSTLYLRHAPPASAAKPVSSAP